MNSKKIISAIIIFIGFLGTFVGIVALEKGLGKNILMGVFIALLIVGIVVLISDQVDFSSAWSILTGAKKIGLRKIFIATLNKNMPEKISNSRRIRIFTLSGASLIKSSKNEIIKALVNNKAYIQVLVCEPDTQFVLDTDEIEGRGQQDQISNQIHETQGYLEEYAQEACKGRMAEEIGEIKIGFYSTQLRSTLVICDNDWGWLTFSLPPERAVQSISFELSNTKDGLLGRSIRHFDRCWEIANIRGKVTKFPRSANH